MFIHSVRIKQEKISFSLVFCFCPNLFSPKFKYTLTEPCVFLSYANCILLLNFFHFFPSLKIIKIGNFSPSSFIKVAPPPPFLDFNLHTRVYETRLVYYKNDIQLTNSHTFLLIVI